jgi:5'-nucleotidase
MHTTMPTKTILVDQDNVIADQFGALLSILEAEHPHIWSSFHGTIHDFQIEKNFDHIHQETILNIRRATRFFASLPPLPGAIDALEALHQMGHHVFIVTAPIRTPHSASEKLEWVTKHLGANWTLRTILTRDKTLVRGDVLIDDNPEVLGALPPLWEHIYFDQPYNQEGTKRRLNWENYREILEI